MSEIWVYFTKDDDDVMCNGCSFSSGKRFREADLWSHLKSSHRDVYERTYEFENGDRQVDDLNRFDCKECPKSFRYRARLKAHLITHSGERRYECQQCKKRFKQKAHLQRHGVVHTEEQPYECPTCKRRFKLKEHLQRPSLVHTEERAYECPTCAKRFRQKAHFQKHGLLHTGERPHECNACGKRFSTAESLKRHTRLHALEQASASADASAPTAVAEGTSMPIADDLSLIRDD